MKLITEDGTALANLAMSYPNPGNEQMQLLIASLRVALTERDAALRLLKQARPYVADWNELHGIPDYAKLLVEIDAALKKTSLEIAARRATERLK